MHTHAHIHTHTLTHTYTYTYTHRHKHTHRRTHWKTKTNTHTQTHTHEQTYTINWVTHTHTRWHTEAKVTILILFGQTYQWTLTRTVSCVYLCLKHISSFTEHIAWWPSILFRRFDWEVRIKWYKSVIIRSILHDMVFIIRISIIRISSLKLIK